jgi:hypothetical protein
MEILKKDFTISSNHPDLELLCQITKTSPDDLRGSSHGGSEPYESNYMKVYSLRYWGSASIAELEKQIEEVNKKTSKYNFVLDGVSDYEVEWDNDRTWPASFGFKSIKK